MRFAIPALAVLLLAACGQSGALYLPEKQAVPAGARPAPEKPEDKKPDEKKEPS